jgi:UDP-3-O-[3-hydroxymyristoyl] glucosamine N-acyltransferase
MALTLERIAEFLGADLHGDARKSITGVATLQGAGPDQISFFANPRYRPQLTSTRAGAVILSPEYVALCPTAALVCTNPQLAFARLAGRFAGDADRPCGVHDSAVVSESARVAEGAWIGPQCTVEADAVIESGAFVGPGCVIGAGARIGRDSRLVAKVVLCHGVELGQRVLLHPGVVIGADGFGLANDAGRWVKIPQLGGVRIGNDVEIGANTTVDRGALDDTVIGEGVKLDNQIQVGHNVHIGAHTAIAGGVMIGGSTRIGRHCMIGGGSCISGHLEITDRVVVTGMTGVSKSITEPGMYSSALTAEPSLSWNRIRARVRQIDDFARRLLVLEKTLGGGK